QQFRVQVPNIARHDFFSHAHSPWQDTQLITPTSFSYFESSFARRLQRSSLERACRLLTMPYPPPKRMFRVFQFCLRYESKSRILQRVQHTLKHTRHESLDVFTEPFHHLGGAGTHFLQWF